MMILVMMFNMMICVEGDEQADGAGVFQIAEYAKCTYCLAVLNH